MRTEVEIAANARPGQAFSNGTSWEIWQGNWCFRGNGCINDEMGAGPEGRYCPLITVALTAEPRATPAEWVEGEGIQDYTCTEFEEDDGGNGDEEPGDPQPEPAAECDGQLDLVDAYLPAALDELLKAPVTS